MGAIPKECIARKSKTNMYAYESRSVSALCAKVQRREELILSGDNPQDFIEMTTPEQGFKGLEEGNSVETGMEEGKQTTVKAMKRCM